MTVLTKFIATALAILSPCTTFAANANTVTIEDMKEYLLDIGVPETSIEYYSDEKIESTFQEFYGKTVTNNGTDTSYLYITNYGDIAPCSGVIKEADMTLSITTLVTYSNYDNKTIEHFSVYINYEWLNIPMVIKEDAAIVNWDSSVFTYKADSFYSINYTHYAVDGKPGSKYTYLNQPVHLLQDSLGYTIQLPYSSKGIYKIDGCAEFKLLARNNPMYLYEKSDLPSTYYTTAINVQYRHNGNALWNGVGISISGVSITFDSDWLTYTTARATNIYYKN